MRDTRSLLCYLNDKEMLHRCDELAQSLDQIDTKRRLKKEAVEEMTEEIEHLEARMKTLARIIRAGAEPRDVKVLEVKNDTTFTVEIIRQDTLEPIETRPMSEAEIAVARQGTLPLEGANGKKTRKTKPPAAADGGGPTGEG